MDNLRNKILKFYKLIIITVLPLILMGCPQTFVREIEKSIPKKGIILQRPTYLKSFITVDKLNESIKNAPNTSIGSGNADSSENTSPLKIEIRSVNSKNFPDEVILKAYVFDTAGHYVTGLAPPFLEAKRNYREFWKLLKDSCNGQITQIDSFKVTEIREDAGNKHAISFVLDHSPSMGSRVAKLRETVKKMIGSTKKGDYISLTSFSSMIFNEIALTDSSDFYYKNFVFTKLQKYGGGTSIYDAVVKGVNELKKAPHGFNKIMILFTDGGDNSSKIKLDSAMKLAKENDVVIYSIAFGFGMNSTEPLIKFAEYTGGRFYNIMSDKEFAYVFADIYLSIYNYYKISYKAPDCKSYHSVSTTLFLPSMGNGITAYGSYDKSVFTKIDPVGTIVFKNIEFDFGKATVKQESLPLVLEIADALKKNENIQIEIRGHTDDVGSEEFNLKLSEKRAGSVIDELIKSGISNKRLKSKGFGKSAPLVPNDSEEKRRKNRRTEFVIIDK